MLSLRMKLLELRDFSSLFFARMCFTVLFGKSLFAYLKMAL